MRLDLSSLARSASAMRRPEPGSQPGPERESEGGARAAVPGVHIDVAALVRLDAQARDFHLLPRQPVHSVLAGHHASRVRGRGLEFEELRSYLFGDDIRTMDWRVTARTGKPHVRVHTEEKDRPLLLLVDQRMNMFFGTRRAMKSVAAAEVAALVAWRVLADGDRVGGLVFGDAGITQLRPQRSRGAVLHLLGEIARYNQALRADAPAARASGRLNEALLRAARLANHDHLVVVVSDFEGHDARTRDLLLGMAVHNNLLAVLVHDPFLSELPAAGDLVVTDGELQVELGFGRERVRRGIGEFVGARGREIFAWQHGIGVPVLPLSAAEDTAMQLRRLLGRLAPGARRGRA
jgi:uncharacterized protein (DUF58 family)